MRAPLAETTKFLIYLEHPTNSKRNQTETQEKKNTRREFTPNQKAVNV